MLHINQERPIFQDYKFWSLQMVQSSKILQSLTIVQSLQIGSSSIRMNGLTHQPRFNHPRRPSPSSVLLQQSPRARAWPPAKMVSPIKSSPASHKSPPKPLGGSAKHIHGHKNLDKSVVRWRKLWRKKEINIHQISTYCTQSTPSITHRLANENVLAAVDNSSPLQQTPTSNVTNLSFARTVWL